MAKETLLDKFRKLVEIIRFNGGVWRSIQTLYRIDDLKEGQFVGIDRNGNRYYYNPRYPVGKSRWVVYAGKFGLDYDSSSIDPIWYPWLHYQTDKLPTESPSKEHKWMISPLLNRTGTSKQYVPYSTPPPNLDSWDPNKKKTNVESWLPKQQQNEQEK